MGRSKGPETGRRGGAGGWWAAPKLQGCAWWTRPGQPGWLAVDYKRQRDGETRRPKETDTERSCQVASSPASSRECCGPWSPWEPRAKCTPSPSQSACWSARCPLARRLPLSGLGLLPLPELPPPPLPHFLLLSLCQTHLELFKPNIQPLPLPSQIPPQFKCPALALRGGREGALGRGGGSGGRLVRGGFISV